MVGRSARGFSLLLAAFLASGCGVSFKPLPEVAVTVAKARGGDLKALATLTRYFSSPVEGEDLAAFAALVEAGEKAVPALIEALGDDDPKVAEAAAGALGNIKDPRAMPALVEALDRPKFPTYVAVWALGEIGRPEVIPTLVRQMGSENVDIRKYAARALIKVGGIVVPAVIAALDDPNPAKRHYAARVLGQMGDQRAIAPLMARYRTLDPEAGLWALGRLGAREALPLISEETGNPDWKVRLVAVQALAALQDPRAIPILRKALDDGEWAVREWAARGLEDTTVERQAYRDQTGSLVYPFNLYR